jgi:hypothetical protein
MFENQNPSKELDFINLFQHIGENKLLAKAMLGKKGGNIMTEFLKNKIALEVKRRYSKKFGRTKDELRILMYLSDASGASVLSLIVSWIEDDPIFNAKAMASKAQNLVKAIIES